MISIQKGMKFSTLEWRQLFYAKRKVFGVEFWSCAKRKARQKRSYGTWDAVSDNGSFQARVSETKIYAEGILLNWVDGFTVIYREYPDFKEFC